MKKYLQPEEKITVCRVDKKDLRSRNRPQLTADLNNFIKKNFIPHPQIHTAFIDDNKN